jgi:hypothetical protein
LYDIARKTDDGIGNSPISRIRTDVRYRAVYMQRTILYTSAISEELGFMPDRCTVKTSRWKSRVLERNLVKHHAATSIRSGTFFGANPEIHDELCGHPLHWPLHISVLSMTSLSLRLQSFSRDIARAERARDKGNTEIVNAVSRLFDSLNSVLHRGILLVLVAFEAFCCSATSGPTFGRSVPVTTFPIETTLAPKQHRGDLEPSQWSLVLRFVRRPLHGQIVSERPAFGLV